jgi:hypothetical protein
VGGSTSFAEERHRSGATHALFEFFARQDYEGFFLRRGAVLGVEAFDVAAHQSTSALRADGGRR